MADEEINGDTDDIQHDKDKTQKKTAKHDSGVADLEKVTDYAEEKEISSQDISGVSYYFPFKVVNLPNVLFLSTLLRKITFELSVSSHKLLV